MHHSLCYLSFLQKGVQLVIMSIHHPAQFLQPIENLMKRVRHSLYRLELLEVILVDKLSWLLLHHHVVMLHQVAIPIIHGRRHLHLLYALHAQIEVHGH
jgi:hypothetical protein